MTTPSNPVGYLVHHPFGLVGQRGIAYDYVLASNGIFVETEGRFLAARAQVSRCGIDNRVRGLAPCWPRLVLRHGLVPRYLFNLALDSMLVDPRNERYVAILWESYAAQPGGYYHLHIPEQTRGRASVEYERHPNTVVEMHSHGSMSAFFSGTDNRDEVGLGVYGVVGGLPRAPELNLRVGIYGHFQPVTWEDVFDGVCPVDTPDKQLARNAVLMEAPLWEVEEAEEEVPF